MKRLAIVLLALLLCLTAEGRKTICYVPLDNRPISYERVVYLCNSMGFDILIPEKGLAFSYLKDISYKSCGFGESSLSSNEPCSFNYVLDRLNRSEFVTSIHPFRTVEHGTISVSDFSRPFDRSFEILFEVNIEQ